ncbi:MAG: hypothetical protein RR945_02210 [Erysipelotrichaceae bacterium]
MNHTQKKHSVSLMGIGTVLMSIKVSFDVSKILFMPSWLELVIIAIFLLCFLIEIIHNKYTMKTLLLSILLAIVAIVTGVLTTNYAIIITIVLILAVGNKDIDKYLVLIFKTQLLFLIIHLVLSGMFLIVGRSSEVFVFARNVTRWQFGFVHPNAFSLYIFNLLMIWCWINYTKIRITNLLIILLIMVCFTLFTKTRTSMLISIIFILLLYFSINKKFSRILKFTAKFCIPCLFIITYLLIKTYSNGNPFSLMINNFLTGRIQLGAYGYERFGLTMFGQQIRYLSEIKWDPIWKMTIFTFDNLYSEIMCNIGIIWALIISTFMYKIVQISDNKISSFIIAWALYGITEVNGLNVFLCFPIVFLAYLLKYRKNEEESDKTYEFN